jgi:hypothetical protein
VLRHVQTELDIARGFDRVIPELHGLRVGDARTGGGEIPEVDPDGGEDRSRRQSASLEVRDERQDQARRHRDVFSDSRFVHSAPHPEHGHE